MTIDQTPAHCLLPITKLLWHLREMSAPLAKWLLPVILKEVPCWARYESEHRKVLYQAAIAAGDCMQVQNSSTELQDTGSANGSATEGIPISFWTLVLIAVATLHPLPLAFALQH